MKAGVHVHHTARVDPGRATLAPPVVIAEGAIVDDGARIIGPAAVLRGARIRSGAQIEASVVGAYSDVGAGAQVNRKLVYGEWVVDVDRNTTERPGPAFAWIEEPAIASGTLLGKAIRDMEAAYAADRAA